MFFKVWIFLFSFILLCSCDKTDKKTSYHSLKIGENTIFVEVADTEATRATGLMHRSSIPENYGMLFVYSKPAKLSFWMKNTHIPLSIAFLDEKGIITDIFEMAPYDGRPDYSLPSYSSQKEVKYALEMRQGFFKGKNIKVGDLVKFPDAIRKL